MDRNVFYDKFRFAQVVPEACGCSSNDFSDISFTSYIFNYVASGEGTYAINGRTYEVKAGDVFISPPYLPTSQRSTGERRWEKLWVACVLINPEASFVLNQLTAACRVASCEELGQLFRDITERADGTLKNAYYTCGKLYELLYALAERVQTIDENGSIYIEYAKEYINAHFSEHLMIADVAAMLSLDRSYFSRLFYAETQMTAKSYLEDVRLRHAANMLSMQRRGVRDVALSCGYRDICSFSRAFKKKYNVSPSRFAPTRPDDL